LQEFLRDRRKVQQLVDLFDPVVRAVDGIAGERVSMRVRCFETKSRMILDSSCVKKKKKKSVHNFVLDFKALQQSRAVNVSFSTG